MPVLSHSIVLRAPSLWNMCVPINTKHLLYLPGQCIAPTTVTVPGTEEDYPYTSDQSIIRKSGLFCGVGMVGCLMDGSCDFPFTRVVFISSLHFYTLTHIVLFVRFRRRS